MTDSSKLYNLSVVSDMASSTRRVWVEGLDGGAVVSLDQIEPLAGFCASSPGQHTPDPVDVTDRSAANDGGKMGSEYQIVTPRSRGIWGEMRKGIGVRKQEKG